MKGNIFVNYLFISIILLLIASCAKEEDYSGGGPVRFRIELNGRDSDLNGMYNYKKFESPRLSGERTGKSGLLVFYSSFDAERNIPVLSAFDIACPYDGDVQGGKIGNPDDNYNVTCNRCKSVYSLTSGGRVESGPAKRRLYIYRITPELPYRGFFNISN